MPCADFFYYSIGFDVVGYQVEILTYSIYNFILSELNCETLEHPSDSLDLVLTDFHLFRLPINLPSREKFDELKKPKRELLEFSAHNQLISAKVWMCLLLWWRRVVGYMAEISAFRPKIESLNFENILNFDNFLCFTCFKLLVLIIDL